MKKGPYIAIIAFLLAATAFFGIKYFTLLHQLKAAEISPAGEATEIAETPTAAELNVEPQQFNDVLKSASEKHEKAVTAPIDASSLRSYCIEDPSTGDLLSAEEINALLSPSEHRFSVSRAAAESDVDLLFRALHASYCAYYYFGEDRFAAAEENIMNWLEQFDTVQVGELEGRIAEEMSFVADAHAIFGAPCNEAAVRYEYFYAEGLYLSEDNGAYTASMDGERWKLEGFSDERVTVEPTLTADGAIVYAPVLFCPATEVGDCEVTFRSESGQTRTETLSWTEGRSLPEPVMRPDVKNLQINGIQYISVRSFMGDFDPELQNFIRSGADAANAQMVIFDLRGNHGGDDRYGVEWVRNFNGNDPSYTLAVGNRFSMLRSAAFGEGTGMTGKFDLFEKSGSFLPNDIPIIVLVDDGCASSGESMLNFLKTLDNTLVVGTNSGGYQLGGNNLDITLPNTGILAYFGVSLTFPYEMESVDYKGYRPDVWCSADTALESVLNMLVRYGLADRETADGIAGKAITKYENVTLDLGFGEIRPGETGGSAAGEFVLYPLLDGRRITDYTYSCSSNGVLTHEPTQDGGIRISVIGGGVETITITVNGTDYPFNWFSDAPAGQNAGAPAEGNITLSVMGGTVFPGGEFGAERDAHYIDVFVGGQRVTDFTYEIEQAGILYHRMTRGGSIAVAVIGEGKTPIKITYGEESAAFIWVTAEFSGEKAVPDDPEDFFLDFNGMDIIAAEHFGAPSGSYVLIPMLNGEATADYSLDNQNPEVVSAEKKDDGSIEINVVGDGSARLVITVHGKEYVFFWEAWH